MSSRRRAPLGVKVIVALGVLGSGLALLGGLVLLGLSGQAAQGGGIVAGLGLLVIVLSLAQFVVLYGLLKLTSWGYKWAMGLYGLSILLNLYSVVTGSIGSLFPLLVQGIIVLYLYSRRDLFVGRDRGPAEETPTNTAGGTRRRRGRR